MSNWEEQLDWREILSGVGVGVVVAAVAGAIISGLLFIYLSDLVQAVITYLPASFWAGYRARRGSPLVNALCAGGVLYLLSSVVYGLAAGLAFPPIGAWLIQTVIIAGIAALAGILARLLQADNAY